MQNKSKREKLKELRRKKRSETDEAKKNILSKQIHDLEDELLEEEFDDENIKRFNSL